jgi:hypothetical protein
MIDFKNISSLKIVKKFSYEGNVYYLRECSEKQCKHLSEKYGDDGEKIMYNMWLLMVCDEDGELLNLSEDIVAEIPNGLKMDMCNNMLSLASGKKKA